MSTVEKLGLMLVALGIFAVVFVGILVIAARFSGRVGERIQAGSFVLPAVLFIMVGLIYPALLTIRDSFVEDGSGGYGLQNYVDIFTQSAYLTVLKNTALWVILVPVLATAIGLVYAIVVDRSPWEKAAKALVFLPMAISMVGASIIWKFVYEYKPSFRPQIGVLNALLNAVGIEPRQFLLDIPMNTFFLIIVMVWIQAGFAMTILSAAIKAIPDDIVEASQLDGVNPMQRFRFITLPAIRPAVVVVLTTIGIGTLKVFDIVRTMTGGQFETSIVANEFYSAYFSQNRPGLASALAVILFVLVVPIVTYNVIQMRKDA
ncbi:sugar ABC transporter permease [Janibacter sp. YIM B02568]|uniref:carbohydrate ABC transporter permease n=1 Tax=Janibacter endophyticus TaxID=2806261 RepID=UPI001951A3C4|nr:sugar ABC transporter permease [Janibacter endophyticus]MBM6545612.1 sugar ABC transporter permease [Janibacter endophyticus]